MFEDIFFSQLEKYKLIDKNGKEIGHIGDLLIDTKTKRIKKLIVFGSFLEEKLESAGVKEDVDELVPLEVIEKVENRKITLSKNIDELETTTKDWKVPEGMIQFSKLRKVKVFDKENSEIGNIIDFAQHEGEKFTVIIGGGFLEEFLEKLRIFADKDLIVPSQRIESWEDEKIVLKAKKIDLQSTVNTDLSPSDMIKNGKMGFASPGFQGRWK